MATIIDGRIYRTFSVYEWSPERQRWLDRKEQTGWLDACGVLGDAHPRNAGRFLVLDDLSGDDVTEQAINAVEAWPTHA